MRYIYSLCVALLVECYSTSLRAEPLSPIPPGEDKIEPLTQGQVSPFSGQLFDNKTALRWGNYLQQCNARLKLDPELVRRQAQAEIDGLKAQAQLQQVAHQQIVDTYKLRIQELEKETVSPPFYRTPWFGFTLGVVGTIATVGTTALIVSSLSKLQGLKEKGRCYASLFSFSQPDCSWPDRYDNSFPSIASRTSESTARASAMFWSGRP